MKVGTIRGIVVKVTKNQIVVLTDEGTFKNILLSSYDGKIPIIGEEIVHIEKQQNKFTIKPYLTVASILILLVTSYFLFPFGTEKEAAYVVAIDINPSIELTTDEKLTVIAVDSLNEEGQLLLESINWKNDLYTVLEMIIDQSVNKGYIASIDDQVIATSVITLVEEPLEITKDIEKVFENKLGQQKMDVDLIVANDSIEIYEEAKSSHLSVNHYKQYKELENLDIVQDKDEIKGKTISELKKMENEQKKLDQANEKANGNDSRNENKNKNNSAEKSKQNNGKNNENQRPPQQGKEENPGNQGGNGKGNNGNQNKPHENKGKGENNRP